MAQIKFDQVEGFFSSYGINEGRFRNDMDLFRYICYENLELIRGIKLPVINPNSEKEAVIVESRVLPHFEFILRNAILKLGSDWSHTVVCGSENFDFINQVCSATGSKIKILKLDTWSGNNLCNNLMYDLSFWKFLTGDYVLVHQEDSVIFRKNADDFIGYDYLGAPWASPPFGLEFGNGGFSLRNRNGTVDILSDTNYVNDIISLMTNQNYDLSFGMDRPVEDVFFSMAFKLRPVRPANFQLASNFSSEQIVNEHSFGAHKFWPHDPNWGQRMLKLIDGLTVEKMI